MEELKKRSREGSEWERERRLYFEEREMKVEEVERRKENGEVWEEDIIKERRERNRRERWKKSRNRDITAGTK